MKIQRGCPSVPRRLLGSTTLLLVALAGGYSTLADQPVITSIQPAGTNILIDVAVPAGFQRVTLESRSRLGDGTWSPLSVGQNDGAAKTLHFRAPCSKQSELIRVRADVHQALPSAFYKGPTSFSGVASGSGPVLSPGNGVVGVDGASGPAAGDPTRSVAESDIWRLDGDRLYFFNQYRGLQVIDISKPDSAFVRGTLELPAQGEQMYLADSNHVVLLANGPCGYGSGQSQVVVVDVSKAAPVLVTNLPLEGWIQDSRMVGTALYVSAEGYRPSSNNTNDVWEWGMIVTSFDLTNPEQPVKRSSLWYSGYGNVVSATDTYLFVVTQDVTNWWQSVIQIIDVTSPDGTMAATASLKTSGRVPDKFKLNYTSQVFTAISEDWHWASGSTLMTKLETFRLPDPRSAGPLAVTKLGELQLGSGERLHATRFDGDLAYVVTFFQIDPLWVVDLSDPAKPHIAGSVNVPGWSSYIAPLGDRLVTVGVESNRVAVSLFDVHDPSQPALLSRQRLGENYSWSDANYDEKAFTVLSDQGLVLVPYNGDTTNGWTSQVQLLDLTRTNLLARGIINHQFQPRRTAFAHDRILSLSGWELLSVDATDRDHPDVKGDLQLAWSVDRVFVQGDYLLELSGSTGWWGYQSAPSVRVTPLHQHDQVLNTLNLDNVPVVGSSVKDGRLYIAQSQSYWFPPLPAGPGGSTNDPPPSPPNFFVTILDVSHLPSVSILGQTSVTLDTPSWGSTWSALWPKADVLIWAGGGSYYLWALPVNSGGISTGLVGGTFFPWWGGTAGGQLLAFDVHNPATPTLDSYVNRSTNGWGFSQSFSSGTLVYLSHTESEVITNSSNTNGIWIQNYLLDVIDYADPLAPTVRKPVSIPGTLQGLSHEGELLYTTGTHWDATTGTDWTQWLDASAYDGVAAHLVASQALPESWPHPILVAETNIFIGRPGYSYTTTNLTAHRLETWSLSDGGSFTVNGNVNLSQPANVLFERNGLLMTQESDGSLALFDDSTPYKLLPVGTQQPSGCTWFDLTQADGAINTGVWLPLGAYGVKEIDLGP